MNILYIFYTYSGIVVIVNRGVRRAIGFVIIKILKGVCEKYIIFTHHMSKTNTLLTQQIICLPVQYQPHWTLPSYRYFSIN